jgi:hypothetical protein
MEEITKPDSLFVEDADFVDDELEDDDLCEDGNGEDQLYEHYHFVVEKGKKTVRIDKYLADIIEGTSRNRIQNAADAGFIL